MIAQMSLQVTLKIVIQEITYLLISLMEEFSLEEKVIFLAVAETEKSDIKSPLQILKSYGVVINSDLKTALETLEKENFIQVNNQLENHEKLESRSYQIQIESIPIWLNQFYPFQQSLQDLDILNHRDHPQYQSLNQSLNQVRHQHQTLQGQEEIQNIFKEYQNILQEYPNCYTALSELAQLCLDHQKYEKAHQYYRRLYLVNMLKYAKRYVQSSFLYAAELYGEENWAAATEIYQKLFKENLLNGYIGYLENLLNYCYLLLEKEQFSEAETIYKMAYQLDEKVSLERYLYYLKQLGDLFKDRKNYVLAIKYYGKIQPINSKLVSREYLEILNYLIIQAIELQEFNSARTYLLQALAVNPDSDLVKQLNSLQKSVEKSLKASEIVFQRRLLAIIFFIGFPFILIVVNFAFLEYQKKNPIPQVSPSPSSSQVN